MKAALLRLLSDYGMILVLLVLCAAFSVLTYREQPPTDAAAGRQLAAAIIGEFGEAPRVLIVVRNVEDDAALAEALRGDLEAAGGRVPAVVKGEPKDARAALVKISDEGSGLDVIAATQETAAWLLFSDLKADFPQLGTPRVMTPKSYHWPSFLKANNLLNIADQIAVIAIIAIGMTMVVITGGIDLSVGSLVALSAVLTAKFIRDAAGGMDATPAGMTAACLAATALCGVFGAFSGAMRTRFDVPPFIVTLSIMLIAKGLAFRITEGQSIFQIPESFQWLGRGKDLFDLPNSVVLMLVLYLLAHLLMSRMRWGRYLYAVGGNREAARLSGVPVARVVTFAYIASAVLAGLGGVIMASQHKSGSATYGNMYELSVIAAVVVGGASLGGGEGRMLGTLTGAFTIAVMQNGMNLTGVDGYTQMIVLGAVIGGAVLVDKIQRRRRG
jgi:ribose transport system permease protein